MGKKMKKQKPIEEQVFEILNNEHFEYKNDVYVGGTVSNIYFSSPTSGSAIINVRDWKPTEDNIKRASKLSESIKNASGVDHSYVVLPTFVTNNPQEGVISISEIHNTINELAKESTNSSRKPQPVIREDIPSKTIFAALPFSEIYYDTFYQALQPACLEVDAKCIRVDHEQFVGDIVEKIHSEIKKSILIIADVSESRPNVLYELGYAIALKKPTIQICSTNLKQIPFDINHNKTLSYKIGNTYKLKQSLLVSLKEIIRS